MNLHLSNTVIQRLSANELTILEYIYTHYEEVIHMNIRQLSDAVSFSSATILRFCKKLGLSGFSELKFTLRSEMESSIHNKKEIPSLSNQIILDNINADIEGTANLIKSDHFKEIITLLDSDLPLYLWAPGGITSVLTEYLEKLLFVCGRQKVYKFESVRMGEHVLRSLKHNAILFLISTSGTYEPTIRLARLANINQIYLFSITPFNNNTIAQLTQYNLHFFTSQRENEGAEITSRLPIFYILSILIQYYIQYKEGNFE